MTIRTKVLRRIDSSVIFWMLVSAVVALSLFYMFAVNKTVLFVAERESVETKVTALHSTIADLDSHYIALRNDITPDLASSLGYKEAAKTAFIAKKAVSVAQTANAL